MNSTIRSSVLAASIAAVVGLAHPGQAAAQAPPPQAEQAPTTDRQQAPAQAQQQRQQAPRPERGQARPAQQARPAAPVAGQQRGKGIQRQTVDRIISEWAPRPRLGAEQLMAKYGPPTEASGSSLVWRDAGPFRRIEVMNMLTPHDFPMPHVDFMEHTILYEVPEDKLAELLIFDGSSTINRTTGELSARCDLEAHNVLTLNLNHDIVTGKKTVEEARQAFGDIVQQEMMGKRPQYTQALVFKPAASSQQARFTDEPVLKGAPVRAAEVKGTVSGDAQVLASLLMLDRNNVLAAMQAQGKDLSQPVEDYVRMQHQEHGKHFAKTIEVGQQAGITPVITPEVEKIATQGAQMLVPLVSQDGVQFERSFVDAMVKAHTNALDMIDNRLMQNTDDQAVTEHLQQTRKAIAVHLERARSLNVQGQQRPTAATGTAR